MSLVAAGMAARVAGAGDDPKEERPPGSCAQEAPLPAEKGAASPQAPEAPEIDLHDAGIKDHTAMPWRPDNEWEFRAWCQTIVAAKYTSQAAFASSARRDLTFVHLFEEPAQHRGEVVHVEGRLKRVRRLEAPSFVWSQGVRHFYEGWIFDPEVYGANPMCLVFTDLPAGLRVSDHLDRHVAFDGYFFKVYRYESAEIDPGKRRHVRRDAPLLLGHTLVLNEPARSSAAADDGSAKTFVAGVVGLMAVTIALLLGLNWWYRRADRRVRTRVLAARGVPDFDAIPGEEAAAKTGQVGGETGPFA